MKSHPAVSAGLLLTLTPALALAAAAPASPAAPVTVQWLDGAPPPVASGIAWGVPFPRGAVQPGQSFSLTSAAGAAMPLQVWPMAYWPDGSIKWNGFATVATPAETGSFTLAPAGAPSAAGAGVQVNDTASAVEINTGNITARIPKSGSWLIETMSLNGVEIARQGQLVCILQDGPQINPEDTPARERYVGQIKKVTVEQTGPVRAVVKIEGVHKGVTSGVEWLPFAVRLYFYAGAVPVRMTHTFFYDGLKERDFIRGLGVTFAVPLRDPPQARRVQFTGEGAHIWSESLVPWARGGRAGGAPPAVAPAPEPPAAAAAGGRRSGVPGPPPRTGGPESRGGLVAVWSDYRLVQPNPDGFVVEKRTNSRSTWIYANGGKRAGGLAFIGDDTGGLGIALKNFWQLYPTELEVQNGAATAADLTLWLWSPAGPAMDMRYYDIRGHGLPASYEDYQPGMDTPYGVGRTSDITLFPLAGMPAAAYTDGMGYIGEYPPLLTASPAYVHSTGVFGFWSLPDSSTAYRKAIEDGLSATLDFYLTQPGEHRWYGFWNYGDVMHAFDNNRNMWRYDVGGYAWDNTELAVPLWLSYSYLRTGRPDLFRFLDAYVRNTSETNVYHIGPMQGLGSRHNVVKWGDGAKEARVAQSAHWRPYYYLTTDERVGDIMRENLEADNSIARYDPMRVAQPPLEGHPTVRIRTGPDWYVVAGNWMTEWERTNDPKWRDRILRGVKAYAKMPYGLRTGRELVQAWNPETGEVVMIEPVIGNYNLATIQGGGEVGLELSTLLDDPDWQRLWLQYCRLLDASAEVFTRDNETNSENPEAVYGGGGGNGDSIPRLAAYAYYKTRNPAYAQAAVSRITGVANRARNRGNLVDDVTVLNPVTVSSLAGTNGAAQNSLAAIIVMELCADQLPAEAPPPGAGRGRGRGRGAGGGAQNAGNAPDANSAPATNAPRGGG